MAENYCQYCGERLDPDANFCAECGEPVGATGDPGEGTSSWSDTGAGYEGSSGWSASDDRDDEPSGWSTRDRHANGDTTLAALAHVAALFTWVLGPLVVLVATEDEFAKENARNALNWQIVFSIYMVVSFVLVFVLVGFVLLFVIPLLDMILCIVAAVKAAEGEAWKYPLTPDLL